MTLMLWQFVALLAVHWFADFVLQTHWQASNTSKSLNALSRHVASYTADLFFTIPFIVPQAGYQNWLVFTGANAVLHFATDYFTSRWSSKLYAKQDWHNFFVVIGLDQFIHQVTLAVTMWGLLYGYI